MALKSLLELRFDGFVTTGDKGTGGVSPLDPDGAGSTEDAIDSGQLDVILAYPLIDGETPGR
jgi:hypothetical protein